MLRRLLGLFDRPVVIQPASETVNPANGSLDQAYSWGYSAGKIDAAGRAWERGRRDLSPVWETMGDDYLAAAYVGYDRGCEDGIAVGVGARPDYGRPPWRDAEAERLKRLEGIRVWRAMQETFRRTAEVHAQTAAALTRAIAARREARLSDDAMTPEPV